MTLQVHLKLVVALKHSFRTIRHNWSLARHYAYPNLVKIDDSTLPSNSQLFSPFVTRYLIIKHKVWIKTLLYCLITYFLNLEFDWLKQMILITFYQFIRAWPCISQSYSLRGPIDISLKLTRWTNPFTNTHIPLYNLFHVQVKSYNHPIKDDEEMNQNMETAI